MDTVPDSRCGYEHEVSAVESVGATCCWRPIWRDRNRCIWHANAPNKPRDELEPCRPVAGERLDGAILRGVSIPGASWLAGCGLVGVDFTDAVLSGVDLTAADLRRATFRDVDAHGATFARANVEDALFAFTDLRAADFEGTRLYRAVFTNVRVNQDTTFGTEVAYESEIKESARTVPVTVLSESATWSYREIQRLFEENANPQRALRYYVREMDLRRRIAWRTRDPFSILRLEGSRWVMQYGISPWRVVGTSALVILICALLFPLTGGILETGDGGSITWTIDDPSQAPIGYVVFVFLKSLYFSVVTFATLGYGDIQPVGGWARAIAGIEALAGSLLTAILVFVLTWRIR